MKQLCCYIGCEKDVEYMIVGEMGIGYDGTYMCDTYVDEYVGKTKHKLGEYAG